MLKLECLPHFCNLDRALNIIGSHTKGFRIFIKLLPYSTLAIQPICPQITSDCSTRPHPVLPSPSNASLCSVVSWSYTNVSNSKLMKMVNGNRRLGYNLGMWNCRRGLIQGNKEPSTKMIDVKNFLQKKNLHMLCLIEADLHGTTSRFKRLNPLST